MSMFNEEEFKEGLVSELALFELPPTQTSVSDVYYDEIRPLSHASSQGPFEFRISGQNSMDYLDLKNSQLYVRLKVVKPDGSPLAKAEKVGPANLFLQALFSSSEVSLQNKSSVTCNYNPYRAYIHTLLNNGPDTLNSQTTCQGWQIDDADSPGVSDPSGYIGCYLENRRRRNFPHNPGGMAVGTVTPVRCMTACGSLKYTYAAVGIGQFCFCSNTTPDPSRIAANDTKCVDPCIADASETCGSATHLRVFDSLAPISLSLAVSHNVLDTDSALILTPSVVTDGPGYQMKMYYGDGGIETDFRNEGAGLLSRSYHQAGEYTIKASVTDPSEQLSVVSTRISVDVQSEADNLTVSCPAMMITYSEAVCTVEIVRGTQLQLDVAYTDGYPGPAMTQTLSLGDSREYRLGNAVQENLFLPDADLSSTTSTDGKLLHHAFPATQSGHLFGFEYFAVTTGTLDLYIYRPDCGLNEYCVIGHYCVTPGTCGETCSAIDMYSTDIQACATAGPTPIAFIPFDYHLEYSTSVVIGETGYGYGDVTSDGVTILPGDIVAHDVTGAAMLAHVPPPYNNMYSDLYCTGGAGPAPTLDGGLCALSGESHQLKAVYGTGAKAVVPFRFTAPGNVSIQFTVSNKDPAIAGTETQTVTPVVMEGVNASVFDISGCYESTQPALIQLQPYTGNPATVYWDFDDGSTGIGNVGEAFITHTYASPGFYDITANITNPFSWTSNNTVICVQERVAGIGLQIPAYVEVGVPQTINLTLINGTDYNCTLTATHPDGSVDTLHVTEADVVGGGVVPITYDVAGNVTVDTVCVNSISSSSHTTYIHAVERISGVSLTPPGAMVNTDFSILATLSTGSDFTLVLTYDGVPINTTSFNNRTAITTTTQRETLTGPHTVVVTVTNVINSITETFTFVIEVGITNETITCEFTNEIVMNPPLAYAVIPVGEGVSCNVTMDDGTSVVMVIDWGDGSVEHTHSVGQTMAWSSNPAVIPIAHSYSVPSYSLLNVTVYNSFGGVTKMFPVMVMVGVEFVELDQVAPVPFTPPARVNFTWTVTEGPVPIGVSCFMQYGDGFSETIDACSIADVLKYDYSFTAGPVTLNYNISNIINHKAGSISFEIVTPIVDQNCSSDPIAGVPGVPISLLFSAARGPGAGILDLTFDCNTADPAVIGPRKRDYNSPFGNDTELCTYATRGNYSTKVDATSIMETKCCYYTMEILNPVTDQFDVITSAPVDYQANFDCPISYTFNYYGPTPDDAWVEFSYGDGVVSAPIQFAGVIVHPYTYATHGHYNTTVHLYNKASSVTKNVPSGCYADITTVSMDVLREPLVPVGSVDLPGFGVGQDKFRTDELLKVWVTMDGTFARHIVFVNGSMTLNGTNKDVITISITQFGPFNLTVQPVNPLYTGPVLTYNGEFLVPINNIVISDYKNETVAYIKRHFLIEMDSYGTSMCISVNNQIDANPQLYGDPVTCSTAPGEYNVEPSLAEMNAPFHLVYQYPAEGSYTMTATAWNVFDPVTTEFDFVVSGLDCTAPNLNIENRRRNFRFPQKFPRCKRIKLSGVTNYDCPKTLNNTKVWTMKRWDAVNNVAIEDVNITLVPSSVNNALAFDKNYLPYGLYRLNFKVTMVTPSPSGERFFSQVVTFIEVVKCDLIVQIFKNGQNRKTVGPASTLTLSPISVSEDPDVETGQPSNFDSFEMACRDVTNGEAFPESSVQTLPRNYTDLPAGHTDLGGCFQEGPGWLSPFTGSVTFITSILKPNTVYEFIVIGYKDTRSSTFTANIKVAAVTPPEFDVNFKIPGILISSSQGVFFNGNSIQLLVATMISPDCGGCTYQYDWSVNIRNYDYCALDPECMMPLDPKHLVGLAEGTSAAELALYKSMFSSALYSSENLFQVRLTITNDLTGASGQASLNMLRNTPPYNGSCEITPTSGTATVTDFTLTCQDFVDDDHSIAEYKVICEADGKRSVVCRGTEAVYEEVNLPIGDERNNYIVNCQAIVTDEGGAAGTFTIPPIQVYEVSDFASDLTSMANSENDKSDVIEARADLAATAGFSGSMGSLMKSMGRKDETAYASLGIARSKQSTGLIDTRPRPNAFTTGTTDMTLLLGYEETRGKGASLVYKLMNIVRICTVESLAEVSQMLTMIKDLSDAMEFLSRLTQIMMIENIEKAIVIMKRDIVSLSVEEIEDMSYSIMTATANINQAAKNAIESPTVNDLESLGNIDYDTNKDSDASEMPEVADPAAQMLIAQTEANKFDQTTTAGDIFSRTAVVIIEVQAMMGNVMVKSNTPISVSSDSMEATMYKDDPAKLVNTELSVSGGGKIILPDTIDGLSGYTTTVMMASIKASSGLTSDESTSCPYSREVSLSFMDESMSTIPIFALSTTITIEIPMEPNRPADDESSLLFIRPIMTEDDVYLSTHQFDVTHAGSGVKIRFRFGPGEATSDNQLLVLVYKKGESAVDRSMSNVIHACSIPSHTSNSGTYLDADDPYTCFVDSDVTETHGTGTYSIGVRELTGSELNMYRDVTSLPTDAYIQANWKAANFTFSYQLKTTELTCFSNSEGSPERSTKGNKVSPSSSSSTLKCSTNHLTSFAGGWVVVPNTIDFDHVFSNADFLKNPTLYVTVIVIFVVYILAMIWARRKDNEDVTKLGLLPLVDNDPRDKYYYEVIVDTGMRRHAGTESKVYFILSGEDDETDVRMFTNTKRKVFSRGSTDGFLMAVPSPLGALMYLRLWHDNSGKGKMKSWYLNHILVRDVQTDKKYYFIANRWWAVEEDDGQVDRVVPVAGKEQMLEFSHLFAEKATKNLSDGHLWFSVVARPPQSRFTRCQRVSCCLCLLYVSMLANAMFYELATSNANAYQFGPFAISAEQIYIGIAVNLIVFPINFLIIMLFRKSKNRTLRKSRVEAAIEASREDPPTSIDDINPRVQSSMSGRVSSLSLGVKRLDAMSPRPSTARPKVITQTRDDKRNKKCLLPWGCTVFAWILLWLTVLTSAVFVVFYGITFGDSKCRKWITSMIISFLTSIFLTQPLKVLLVAIVFSILIRKPGNEYEDEENEDERSRSIEEDEEYLHDDDDYRLVAPVRAVMKKPPPPNSKLLEATRRERMKEIQMWSIVREILFYVFYLTVLMVISYRTVSTNSYRYKFAMEQVFITTNSTNHTFTKVKNVQDYWIWARTGMLRGLRAGPYYNNYPPFYLRGYINDKQSRLMGYATLRQLRVRPGSCKLPDLVEGLIDECNANYDMEFEEKGNFGPSWSSTTNATRAEYIYRTADSLNGYPYWGEMAMYSGGGYVVNLDGAYETMVTQFEQLEQEKWIDEYTRAVFLEFTVYNPSINLFAIATVLSEFRPSGGVFGSYRFEPCMLLPYMNDVLLFQIACELIYFAFTVYFLGNELRKIYKQRWSYPKQFWNLIEFSITAMSISAVVIYFYRLVEVQKLTDYFSETNGDGYTKFQYVGYWSELFQYMIGFLIFLATIKFLKLLRFNKKICLLASTLKNSSNNLIHFSIIFNVVFLAFVQVFYLVYLRHLTTFKTFIRSSEACVVMMMGKFDIYKMSEVNRLFTQLFLFLFVVTITFIVVNMFLSILNESFSAVRHDENMLQNDYEIVDFILNRFKRWTGIGQQNSGTKSPEELERERIPSDDPVARLDSQIDRFLASVSNMYAKKSKFDDFLNAGFADRMAQKLANHNTAFPPERHPAPKTSRPGTIHLNSASRGVTRDQTC